MLSCWKKSFDEHNVVFLIGFRWSKKKKSYLAVCLEAQSRYPPVRKILAMLEM